MFAPASNAGHSLNSMLLNSACVVEIPSEELDRELNLMEADGLIRKEGEYYWSTVNGQIANHINLMEAGALQAPLKNQKHYNINDLIIAILASHRIDFSSGYDVVQIEAIKVYLHEFSDDEIYSTINRLIESELVAKYDFHPREAVVITGMGYRFYLLEVRQRLGLSEGVAILSRIEPLKKDDRFYLLGFDPQFCQNLESRWQEMQKCYDSGAYLATVVLLGSILEGMLLAKLQSNIKSAMTAHKAPKDGKSGSTKALNEWSLHDYVTVAIDLGYLPKSIEKHVHELRDSRNLVHPHKQINSGIIADESLCRISREIAETIIDSLVLK